uniref:Multiple epidermal growth factor-like domains protein 6 isoform X2 n=1 Tax=Crassostrea virginica TaxID=6565 RepID=A0A8B8B059_CRAVI|nr:multiple epidermal growth factor-like domains protein 6 isoform X2 [Crassostrea virginica]
MHLNSIKSCLLAIVFTHIQGRSMPSTHKPILAKDGTKECFPYYYLNGDICTECPPGYYDDDCSLPCPPPTYGRNCAEQCSCSSASCHHVYGCNVIEECPAGYFGDNCSSLCPPPTYGDGCAKRCSCSHASCHHVYGCNMTIDELQNFYSFGDVTIKDEELPILTYMCMLGTQGHLAVRVF